MHVIRFRLGNLTFTWDSKKYETNVRKHGVTFEDAATTWLDPLAIERADEEHSEQEERWLRIGASLHGELLVVWSSEGPDHRESVIRIIGARRTSRKERERYEQENEKIRRG